MNKEQNRKPAMANGKVTFEIIQEDRKQAVFTDSRTNKRTNNSTKINLSL
jgi:hypothetical protein